MHAFRLWIPTLVTFFGLATFAGAQKPSFELRFNRLSNRINAVKAWGDRVCAIDFDDYQLRCYDRDGNMKLDLDIRDRLSGGVTPITRIVDYTILDDGGVALVGYWLDPSSATPSDAYPYLLTLDRRGDMTALHRLGNLEPKSVGGASVERLRILGLGPEFSLACDPTAGPSSRLRGLPPGALIHEIHTTGEVSDSHFLFDVPDDDAKLDRLRTSLSKGLAIDGAGNHFFWVADDEIVVAASTGERKSVFIPPNQGLFRTPFRLLSRHEMGALAVFMEGENEAPPEVAALGMFSLTNPELRVYAIDPSGRVEELLITGVGNIAGELADGTVVALKGAGRGRSEVVFLGPVAELQRRKTP